MGIFISIILLIAIGFVSLFALYKYKNRRLSPDHFEYYKKQDIVPEGKVGFLCPVS